MSTRIVETYTCDACPKDVECEPTTIAGWEFQLCPKHIKPALAFEALAEKHGRRVANGAQQQRRLPRGALVGVEYVKCGSCASAQPIKVESRYTHARSVHQVATGEIKWLPVS